jgi:GNAT superfamily N-acetyltransferase
MIYEPLTRDGTDRAFRALETCKKLVERYEEYDWVHTVVLSAAFMHSVECPQMTAEVEEVVSYMRVAEMGYCLPTGVVMSVDEEMLKLRPGDVESAITGFALFGVHSPSKTSHIHSLFVAPEARNTGAAAEMLRSVASLARDGGAQEMTAFEAPEVEGYRSLLAAAGFEVTDPAKDGAVRFAMSLARCAAARPSCVLLACRQ